MVLSSPAAQLMVSKGRAARERSDLHHARKVHTRSSHKGSSEGLQAGAFGNCTRVCVRRTMVAGQSFSCLSLQASPSCASSSRSSTPSTMRLRPTRMHRCQRHEGTLSAVNCQLGGPFFKKAGRLRFGSNCWSVACSYVRNCKQADGERRLGAVTLTRIFSP